MSLLVLVTLALASAPQVQGFGATVVGSRPALTVFASAPIEDVRVERSGPDVTVLLAGAELGSAFGGAERFQWDMPEGPGKVQIEKQPAGVTLRMRLAPDMDVEVLKKGKMVALVFGPKVVAAATPPPPPVKPPSPSPPPAPKKAEPAQVAPSPAPTPFPTPRPEKPKEPPKVEKPPEDRPRVVALRATPIDARPAVTVILSRPVPDASVERAGTEVVLSLSAEAPSNLTAPAVEAPLEAIRIQRRPGGVAFHVRVAADVPFQVRRGETLLSVVFGEETAAQARGEGPTDMRQAPSGELYGKLFPSAPPPTEEPPPAAAPTEMPSGERNAFTFGPLAVRPSLALGYVDSDSALFDTPQPVHDQYMQISPAVLLEVRIGLEGRLTAGYEPRFRAFSSYDLVGEPSHIFTGGLALPLGTRGQFTARERFARATLEAQEVDPGGEYFFDLSRFDRNTVDGQFLIDLSTRFGLDFGSGWTRVRFDETSSGFYSYDAYNARAGLYYELTPRLKTTFRYVYDRVPAPDQRPLAESTGHGATVTFDGELGPQLTGSIGAGYLHYVSPRGGLGDQTYSGLTLSGNLRKEFRPGAFVGLTLDRTTRLSNFEANAFYVTTGAYADVTAPIPLDIAVRGVIGYRVNGYQLDASEIGEPRRDQIFTWGLGLGRPIGRWAFVRADYRRDRRYSNLPEFDVTSDAFVVQVGIGLFGSSASVGR